MVMSWLKDFLKPRQDNFMKLLIEQAEYAVKGLEALMSYATHGDDVSADAVGRYEKEADEVRRILVDELNRTFVTPMDREDISVLSRTIDDILDYAYSTVGEMQVLHVTPTPYLQRMVSLLCEAAEEVHIAMQRLKDHPGVAADHAQRAKALENRVESVYREAIAALFEGPAEPEHIVEMLKLREIYRHLSNAADRGDEAANIISDVVVKMT
jgi:predicted phosphate transport protein (TIGR00153 family)